MDEKWVDAICSYAAKSWAFSYCVVLSPGDHPPTTTCGCVGEMQSKHFIEAFESILQNAYKFNIFYRSNMAQNKTVSVGQL